MALHIATKRVLVSELKPGMYISSLDRPWLETPFLMQGFLIHNQGDIEDIAKYCSYVEIDIALSKTFDNSNPANIIENQDNSKEIAKLLPHRKLRNYQDQTTIEEELKHAKLIIEEMALTIANVFLRAQSQSTINVTEVREAVTPMVESISRNPDACIWLTRLRNSDDYTYQHAISSSIWAVALGRHLGFPRADLETIAIGVTLFDIGKMSLPIDLLHKRGRLNHEEFEKIKSHVPLGLEQLEKAGGINNSIRDIVSYHHERHDGTGYPNGLKGNEIPVFARIAAIADCYDAITTKRPYAHAISPVAAIQKLYEWRDAAFQSVLIEEFIQAIGIFPAGTLVELTNGEVGVVLAEYRTRRLRPKIIQLLDKDKRPLPNYKVIDLLVTTEDELGRPLSIKESLEPGSYNLYLESLNL